MVNPVNSYKLCSTRSGELEPGAGYIVSKINAETTTDEFDSWCASTPGYKLENGGRMGFTALMAAAKEGNISLMTHIVNKGGKDLLNQGTANGGWTPLTCAILSETARFKSANILLVVEKLIELGADINIATAELGPDSIPGKATPLYLAAEKAKNLELVKSLMKKGAIDHPSILGEEVETRTYIENPENPDEEIFVSEKIFIPGVFRKEVLALRAGSAKSLLLAAKYHSKNTNSPIRLLPREIIFNKIFPYLST